MMDLLSRAEAAELLGCSVATVRRLQQCGRLLPYYPDAQARGGHGVLAYYARREVELVRREREPQPRPSQDRAGTRTVVDNLPREPA